MVHTKDLIKASIEAGKDFSALVNVHARDYDGSARLFRAKGFEGTSTRDIAAAVGMRSGSPFYHFKSKDALLFAVMEAGMHSALANQQRVLGDAAYAALNPADKLRRLVHAHFEVLLGPGNDFVPVMLYEWRSLQRPQRKVLREGTYALNLAQFVVLTDNAIYGVGLDDVLHRARHGAYLVARQRRC